MVNAAGDDVCLAGELRHPEAVDDIRRLQLNRDLLSDGNMQLADRTLDSRTALLRIGEQPLPLRTRDFDLHRILRRAAELYDAGDRWHDKECEQDHRSDRP